MSATRYDTRTVLHTKRLREAGWSLRGIQDILHKEFGVRPARDTLKVWTDPKFAERRRADHREKRKTKRAYDWNFALGGPNVTPEYKAAFMARLHEADVPRASIAKVCTVVFGEPWSRDKVKVVLDRLS